MCEPLEVSASGYYAWVSRPDSPTEQWRQELVGAIEEVHAEVRQRYGRPRMTAALNARGYECSENAVAELMREHGIRRCFKRVVEREVENGPCVYSGAELIFLDEACLHVRAAAERQQRWEGWGLFADVMTAAVTAMDCRPDA